MPGEAREVWDVAREVLDVAAEVVRCTATRHPIEPVHRPPVPGAPVGAVTVTNETDPIPGLPQRDRPAAGERPAHNAIAAVVPVAPAAEKIVEAVVLLQDHDDVSDWTHRPRKGRVGPGGGTRGQHLPKDRNEHPTPHKPRR